jgi:chaperonin GroES
MTTAQPLHDRLVVRRIEETGTAKGRPGMPAAAKEKPQKGEVLAVGNGKYAYDGTNAVLDVKVGDKILFGKRSGINVRIGGENVLILPEDEFLVVLT